MNISKNGLNYLIQREGERLKAYKDTKGIWTIGVGDIDINNDGIRDVREGMAITQLQSMANLNLDIQWAEDAVNEVDSPLSQNQFDALVSFVFNIGASAFYNSTIRKLLNKGEYELAAKQFDRWVIPKENTKRRMSEKEQFLS